MPRGGKIGNKGNPNGQPRQWVSNEFGLARIPKHLMPDIYRIAKAIDKDPALLEKLRALTAET